MWVIILTTLAALHATNPAELKAAWEKAKAQAASEHRFRYRMPSDRATRGSRERYRNVSPEELAELRKAMEQRAEEMDQEFLSVLQQAKKSGIIGEQKHLRLLQEMVGDGATDGRNGKKPPRDAK